MSEKKMALPASITVFASLTLLLIASFLLTLLEAARVKGLEAYSQMHRINALEAVLSGYDRDIFDRYGIFLLDGGYGTGNLQFSELNSRLQAYSQKNLRPETSAGSWHDKQNFYQMDVSEAAVEGYLLATDCDGAPFRKMAAASMKMRYPLELLKEWTADAQQAEQAMQGAQEGQAAMDQAQASIEEAQMKAQMEAQMEAQRKEQAKTQTNMQTQTRKRVQTKAYVQSTKKQQAADTNTNRNVGAAQQAPQTGAAPPENPMDIVKALKNTDILTLVLPTAAAVSQKQLHGYEMLEHRRLLQGTESFSQPTVWYETVLYHKFLETQFRSFTSKSAGGGALDYELEYIQSGKNSDRENLKGVVHKLLLLREGANYLYLQTDSVKRSEAYELAAAIAAATGIAPATGVIAQGILAAWAYVESVMDVRTLLAGGKVPWGKTASSWNSNLSTLGSSLSGRAQSTEQAQGESYEDYLYKLLYLKSVKVQNYRAMDLIALYKEQCGVQEVRMDTMLVALRADFSYETEPLFFDWAVLLRERVDAWEFSETVYDSYLKEVSQE